MGGRGPTRRIVEGLDNILDQGRDYRGGRLFPEPLTREDNSFYIRGTVVVQSGVRVGVVFRTGPKSGKIWTK